MRRLWLEDLEQSVRGLGPHRRTFLVAVLGMAAPQALLLAMLAGRVPAGAAAAAAIAEGAAASVLALLVIGMALASVGRAAGSLHALAQAASAGDGSRLSAPHPGSGLPTREPFLSDVDADIAASGEPALLAVIRFCDFDRLSPFDHEAADRALHALAARLQGAIGQGRRLAQVDRDCFAVWFSGAAAQDAAGELRAISYVLRQDIGAGEHRMTPELKIGAALFPNDGSKAAVLLTRAFAALPKAGDAQADRLAFFSGAASVAARERFSLEQDLRHAVERDQLKLFFQPVVDLARGRVAGAEALLRWFHPELGSVPPSRFIPVLERSGLIDEVGVWVLNAACREARAWRDRGLDGLTIAVNLSARQFRDPMLSMVILRTLEQHRLVGQNLELELTETAMMQDAARTRQLLTHLKSLGVGAAIDDFGTGYSSLSCLKSLPFSKLKIDREFVTGVHDRADSRAICATLIALAHGLGMTVVAEGVEEPEEVHALIGLGCSLFQGYHFARPLPAADFLETIGDPLWLAKLDPAVIAASRPAPRRAFTLVEGGDWDRTLPGFRRGDGAASADAPLAGGFGRESVGHVGGGGPLRQIEDAES
jgi:EAL domain-containing protein (putative c-di-GMP-specific phosphodiesterase class I)/GGDEF domain-containing protein